MRLARRHQTPWSASSARLRLSAVIGSAICLGLVACGGAAEDVADAADAADAEVVADAAEACGPFGATQEGDCCPQGQFYDHNVALCRPAGPGECAATALAQPDDCRPRWCSSWLTTDGAGCSAGAPGCRLVGRRCSAADLAAGLGCDVGSWPGALGCQPAGVVGEVAPYGGDPAQRPAPPLPPPSLPRWCWNATDPTGAACTAGGEDCELLPRLCVDAEQARSAGCDAGRFPDPSQTQGCLDAGAGALCPPGFVVDTAVKPPPGELAPSKPDPADCGEDVYGGVADDPHTLFVDGAAQTSGAGKRATPLKSLDEALVKVKFGGTIVLAAGVYESSAEISKTIALRGRCAAMVTLVGKQTQAATVLIAGAKAIAPVRLLRMRINGPTWGVAVNGGLGLQGDRLFIQGASGAGVGA